MRSTIVAFAFWAAIGFLALLTISCGGLPPIMVPPVPVKVVTVPTLVPCAKTAPPAWAKVGAPVECVPGVACLPRERFAVLVGDVEALRDWVRQTWALCAPEAK